MVGSYLPICSQLVFFFVLICIVCIFWSEPTVLEFSRILGAVCFCLYQHFVFTAYRLRLSKRFIIVVQHVVWYLILYLHLWRFTVNMVHERVWETDFDTVKFLRIRWFLIKHDGEAAAFFEKVQLMPRFLTTGQCSELRLEGVNLVLLFTLRSIWRANLLEDA